MARYISLFIALMCCLNTACSTFTHFSSDADSLKNVESLLMSKKYRRADIEFGKLNRDWQIQQDYKNVVSWLKKTDKLIIFLKEAELSLEGYKSDGHKDVILKKRCRGQGCGYCTDNMFMRLPKELSFSAQFVEFINKYQKETAELFASINYKLRAMEEETRLTKLVNLAEEKRIKEQHRKKREETRLAKEKRKREEHHKKQIKARLAKLAEEKLIRKQYQRKQEQYRKKREKERLERIAIEKERKKAVVWEIEKIAKLAKALGYREYKAIDVVSMIYQTRKQGGLENYLNTVVGCHKLNKRSCKNLYPNLTVIQVLENIILYAFAEYMDGKLVQFILCIDREHGKMYQEGQVFEDSFYVFAGMVSYRTVLGVKKTVPMFKKVQLHF